MRELYWQIHPLNSGSVFQCYLGQKHTTEPNRQHLGVLYGDWEVNIVPSTFCVWGWNRSCSQRWNEAALKLQHFRSQTWRGSEVADGRCAREWINLEDLNVAICHSDYLVFLISNQQDGPKHFGDKPERVNLEAQLPSMTLNVAEAASKFCVSQTSLGGFGQMICLFWFICSVFFLSVVIHLLVGGFFVCW